MLTLETERLFLRDFNMKDWDTLNAIVSDSEVTHYVDIQVVLVSMNLNYLLLLKGFRGILRRYV